MAADVADACCTKHLVRACGPSAGSDPEPHLWQTQSAGVIERSVTMHGSAHPAMLMDGLDAALGVLAAIAVIALFFIGRLPVRQPVSDKPGQDVAAGS